MLGSAFGLGWFIWMVNYFYDNEGGRWHELYWRVAQAYRAMPLVMMYYVWKVTTSYSFNYVEEKANIDDYEATSAYHSRDQLYRRYNNEAYILEAQASPQDFVEDVFFDEEQITNQLSLWVVTLMFTVASSSSYAHIAQHFHEKRVEADAIAALIAEGLEAAALEEEN